MRALLVVLAVVLLADNTMSEVRCLPDIPSDNVEASADELFPFDNVEASAAELFMDMDEELLSRLHRISASDVEMLADGHRLHDNELVDSVLVANNIVNQLRAASDEELRRRPSNLAALILASNDIDEYIRTHQRRTRGDDRQF
ncbi:unnamed protein product [Heligmosomoides polygyrus]|uniref:Secreted RxLR effector peptide protein n=1 Tax=Heligmosomoides polygyrus TaxID=6339 RepID=A0A3P8BDA1_HELPZ|nr:unnamed protein product [Heligmosomoides polygyrus]